MRKRFSNSSTEMNRLLYALWYKYLVPGRYAKGVDSDLLFMFWYDGLSIFDHSSSMTLMNYGFDSSEQIVLEKLDEQDRYRLQLYHHVVSAVTLTSKNVLEISSGRGGGASYVMRYLKPKTLRGIDYSQKSVEFCRKHFSIPGLSFVRGNSKELKYLDHMFDVVFNIESSHSYQDMESFLSEVFRVLRPGGYFLFADFRVKDKVGLLRQQLLSSGLVILKEENITLNVIMSLKKDNPRKLALIDQHVPWFARPFFKQFAGTKGSFIYRAFLSGDLVYCNFVLQKPVPSKVSAE
jgi:Methylase involved in ubiquinone/menaquinone biosynthesis